MGLTTASTTLTIILYFILTIILYIILTIILYIILTIILYIIGEYHGHDDDDDDDDTILGAFKAKEPNGANGRSQRGSARRGAQRMFEKKRKEADDGSLLGTFR